jgi:hypothetical protein
MRRWLTLAAVVAAVALAACGGGGTSEPESVANISIASPGQVLMAGQTKQLSATVVGTSGNALADRAITWSSSDQSIATVAPGGIVTVVGEGTVNISASAGGITGTVTLTTKFPYPRVSGTYGLQAFFDGVAGTVASGVITFTQASRTQGTLAVSSTLTASLTASGSSTVGNGIISSGTNVLNQVRNAAVDTAGRITFEIASTLTTTTWKFDGTVSGANISGRHTLAALAAGSTSSGAFLLQRNAPFITLVAPNAPVWGPEDLFAALRSVRK